MLLKPKEVIKGYCLDFFSNRHRYIFERQGFRYDLVNAAVSVSINNIYHRYLRLKTLDGLQEGARLEPLVIISKRVNKILRDQPHYKINPDLFAEKEESELYPTFSIVKQNVLSLINN